MLRDINRARSPRAGEETVSAQPLDKPALRRLLRRLPGGARPVRASAGDHVVNRSIYNTERRPEIQSRSAPRTPAGRHGATTMHATSPPIDAAGQIAAPSKINRASVTPSR